MSTTHSGKVSFKCWFDHAYGKSCGGHTLEIEQQNTSDTVSIIIDGELRLCVDQGTWNALERAMEALKQRNAGFWQEADETIRLASVDKAGQ